MKPFHLFDFNLTRLPRYLNFCEFDSNSRMAQQVPQQALTDVPDPIGSVPIRVICPACRADVETTVESKASTMAYLIGFVICFFA